MLNFLLLGFLNCLTFTLTQSPFAKFLSDSGYSAFYLLPILTSSYFFRFLWDGVMIDIAEYFFSNQLKKYGYHKTLILILSSTLLLISTLYLLIDIPFYIYICLFSFFGATQTSTIESYKTEFNSANKQTSFYLFGYRGAKIVISPFIIYLAFVLSSNIDLIISYKIAFLCIALLIFFLALGFFIFGVKTHEYKSKLSILDLKSFNLLFKDIIKYQRLSIFIATIFFRSSDTILSYVYIVYMSMLLSSAELSLISLISCLFSLIGIVVAYRIKRDYKTKNIVIISGILQSLSFLPFCFGIENAYYILFIVTIFKIIGCFATDIISTLMRSNANLVKGSEASTYIFCESFYRGVSIMSGIVGGICYQFFDISQFYLFCFFISTLPTMLFIYSRKHIKQIK